MNGVFFNFDTSDVAFNTDGTMIETKIDNQNVALISLSQVCRITYPEIGAQIGAKIVNNTRSVPSILASAKVMAEQDGAKDVVVTVDENSQLTFLGRYEN